MQSDYPSSIVSWTDKQDDNPEDIIMAADVNQVYAELIAVETNLDQLNPETAALATTSTLITSFYLPTDTSANDMIERALASSPTYKNLYLPRGEYTIIRPIIIPDGISFIGSGSSTVLKPDFSLWQGTDYRVLILKGKEGINRQYNSYNKIVGDFNISGLNAGGVKATGVFVGTDKTIDVGVAVNYAMVNGLIHNIYVEQLDTGFYFKEFDESDAINIQTQFCRAGVLINGKCVNSNFECKLYNASIGFTSDTTDPTVGFDIEQASTYAPGSNGIVGRPEGIFILSGTLIFGFFNNLVINAVLQCTVSGCMLDYGVDTCLITGGLYVDGLTMTRNWFCTSATTSSCILINANAGITNSTIVLDSNRIIGPAAGGGKGIECENHYFIEITKNDISGFTNPIWLNNCFNFNILNNHGHSNAGIFIYNQSYGTNSIIDGNITSDNYKVLQLQPSTSANLVIGNNSSGNSATNYRGKVTITAGQTSISTGAIFGAIVNTPDYICPIVTYSVYSSTLTTQTVKWSQNSNQITFTMSATSATDTTIYFTAVAIPYTAW